MPSHFITLWFLFLFGFLATLLSKTVNSFLVKLRSKGNAYILAREKKKALIGRLGISEHTIVCLYRLGGSGMLFSPKSLTNSLRQELPW